jgi:N-methylhydantoinase A/oxoprolinase/acetone carboxylase beta subunit
MNGRIGIGIDTGGTYTDAVIYDFSEKKVLGTAKTLTTRQDLSIGILEALDTFPGEFLREAGILALSTTLATNACVEDRGGRAKLIFLGGDELVIRRYGGEYGLPPPEEMHIQESFTTFSGEILGEPDWDYFSKSIKENFKYLDGAGIIEIFAMKNNGVMEKRAKEIFQRSFDIPVICGHELFSELNCLQRGSSTLLNAKLFPVIKEFLKAIEKAKEKRHIKAKTVIVRSDGSLMSGEFALVRPVETLLCGPAASIAGGISLGIEGATGNVRRPTEETNCVIVDMGGTTTDLALVKGGFPITVTEGITIGKWRTFVQGFYIKTFGLGGDTAVHYREKAPAAGNELCLEDYKVVPLCMAGAQYPQVLNNLEELAESGTVHQLFLHEHYIPGKGIGDEERYTEEEKRFCRALEGGALSLEKAAAVMGKDIYNLHISRLIKEGAVQVCGLTPTDIMHIKHDFTAYSREASLLAARYTARTIGITVDELCDKVYDEVKRRLYFRIVQVLLEQQDSYYMRHGFDPGVERLILQSYEAAKGGQTDALRFLGKTGFPLVGMGAPIRVFLEDVAKLLGTRAVIPEYYAVANALGAVMGKIYASFTAEVRPVYEGAGIDQYQVFGYNRTGSFTTLKEAEEFALTEALAGARAEASKRGARGEIALSWEQRKSEPAAAEGVIYLGTAITGHASGSLG